jgi:NhaP-type Na+/H+ or K+/H+ antiporter
MIVFEHSLFMLLLLVGVFSSRPTQRRTTIFILALGVLLTLLPPVVEIAIPWELILFLTVPLLFWQNARHWLRARWRMGWGELLLWLASVLGLAGILNLTNYLAWPGALLFGVVTASMLWRLAESEHSPSQVSQIGALTLVFLLTEVAPAVETPNRYLGGLFSGAAIGIATAFLAMFIGRRIFPNRRGWVALVQVYLAYAIAALIEVSAISAALIGIAVYTEFSLRQEIGRRDLKLPAPANNWVIFGLLLVLFVFLGWQAHQPLSWLLLIEAGLGLLVGLIVAWSGRILNLSPFARTPSLGSAVFSVGLFFLAALLLWPRGLLLDHVPLAVALAIALITNVLSATLLSAARDLDSDFV